MVRCERCRSNQALNERLVGREGGGGTEKSLSSGTRAGQSVRDQLGEGGGGEVNGYESIMWTGNWSEPVEGRGCPMSGKREAMKRKQRKGQEQTVGQSRRGENWYRRQAD